MKNIEQHSHKLTSRRRPGTAGKDEGTDAQKEEADEGRRHFHEISIVDTAPCRPPVIYYLVLLLCNSSI